jgi:hypothetical protein
MALVLLAESSALFADFSDLNAALSALDAAPSALWALAAASSLYLDESSTAALASWHSFKAFSAISRALWLFSSSAWIWVEVAQPNVPNHRSDSTKKTITEHLFFTNCIVSPPCFSVSFEKLRTG